jgi:transposase
VKLRSSTDCWPVTCRRCAHPLRGDDPEPLIHQVADLPRIEALEKRSAAALAEPYGELARSVLEAEAVNIDETGWREDRRKAWLWVTVTAVATVFTIARHRSAAVARRLLGDKKDQVVSSDRFRSYEWLWAYWRQVCWSHLRRDFQAMIDGDGPGEGIGRRLIGLSDRLLEAWHRARDGALEE